MEEAVDQQLPCYACLMLILSTAVHCLPYMLVLLSLLLPSRDMPTTMFVIHSISIGTSYNAKLNNSNNPFNLLPHVTQKAHFQPVRYHSFSSLSYNFILLCTGPFCSGVYCRLLILCNHILYFLDFPDLFLWLEKRVVSIQAGRRPGVYRPNPQIRFLCSPTGGNYSN